MKGIYTPIAPKINPPLKLNMYIIIFNQKF